MINDTANLLIPTVGFRQTFSDREFQLLDTSLVADPTQGQFYVNSVSEEYLRVEFMAQRFEYFSGQDHNLWNAGTDYVIGDKVRFPVNNYTFVWVAVADNVGQNPETSPLFWESALSNRLRNYRESAALETINVMISKFTNNGRGRELFNSTVAYQENVTGTDTAKTGRFVGITIVPVQGKLNRAFIARQVGLMISEPTSFNLYLYHSSIFTGPLQTFPITVTAAEAGNFAWYNLVDTFGNNLTIDLYDTSFNQGGVFMFGFFEDDFAEGYLSNELSWPFWQKLIYSDQYWRMGSIEIPPQRLNGTALPDIGQFYDGISNNSQLSVNLRFESIQSYFELFNANFTILQSVYQYTLAVKILQDMIFRDRVNSKDREALGIEVSLKGDPEIPEDKGIIGIKEQHIKKLMADMESIFSSFAGAYAGR